MCVCRNKTESEKKGMNDRIKTNQQRRSVTDKEKKGKYGTWKQCTRKGHIGSMSRFCHNFHDFDYILGVFPSIKMRDSMTHSKLDTLGHIEMSIYAGANWLNLLLPPNE